LPGDIMQRERRWCLRKPISLTVKLHSGTKTVTNCTTQDISLEGFFLETDIRPDPASTIEITIMPPAQQSMPPVQLSARVVHTTADGIGIVIHELSIDAVKTMRQLFYK
jgi:PilZ domain